MAFDQIVHHYEKVADTNHYAITKITPLIRLKDHDEVILIQKGQIMDDGGEVIPEKNLPPWFYDEVSKMTPRALLECGLKEVPKRPDSAPQVAAQEAQLKVGGSEPWQCDVKGCGRLLTVAGKEAHIAEHNRKLGPNSQLKG